MDRLATLYIRVTSVGAVVVLSSIEAARARRNSCDRDNFRMCVIRSHLGHLDRFAPAPMPALMTTACGG